MRWMLIIALASVLGGCGTVTVTAEREGRCRVRAGAPFEVRCWSDGREVLVWSGPMALTVEEVKP